MYEYFCNNPKKKCQIGDCVVRAISKALNLSWETVFIDLMMEAYSACDMPNSNNVWGTYLYLKGFTKRIIPYTYGYTIEDFCIDHPIGTFVVGSGTHAAAVIDGTLYDTWNSSQETIIFYWEREVVK